jgi:hypothetical protein
MASSRRSATLGSTWVSIVVDQARAGFALAAALGQVVDQRSAVAERQLPTL